ncbi:Protein EXORDIUM [Rhynchospora pubera]|uniref:Protein EXORDIUM n=1 Tax=Rhynchospora pubera TaxID=906938 RepID=A0AAV8D3S2_9POAL|nr:Protein EXORDIUM [Rhynchospora pubera]
MASFSLPKSILALLVILTLASSSLGARPRKLDVWIPNPNDYPDDSYLLKYHNGEVLQGNIPVHIIWYGDFSSPQKSIIIDFLNSLTSSTWGQSNPSVAQWWSTIDQLYLSKVSNQQTQINLGNQIDWSYWWGKYLTMSQIAQIASNAGTPRGGITLVLTAKDVTVEEFCSSHCAFHGSDQSAGTTFIWVGNSESQCPGQCAWPFHQPLYGPQSPPLVPPNGDVGIEGMIINLASMLAGAVSNPFGNGYYQGSTEAPMEACTACPGVYGRGAYPGYAGQLWIDSTTGASYNANGFNGREYLLPAIFDPTMATCSTLN